LEVDGMEQVHRRSEEPKMSLARRDRNVDEFGDAPLE
jgi:hypothetical protein